MSIRPVRKLTKAKAVVEGAGVRLHRAFGFGETSDFDPFLLFDDFRNESPADYMAGFPWHPHRGIETITYVLAGSVDHGDSLGNHGTISAGDVQWMTAGSGIVHQEMPRGSADGRMHGFQLWANLPSSLKMTPPRYQEIPAVGIPEVVEDDGTRIRVICGRVFGVTGPVEGIAADPSYVDIAVPPGKRKRLPLAPAFNAFAYIFEGTGWFAGASDPQPVVTELVTEGRPGNTFVDNRSMVLFDQGEEIAVQAGETGIRFLLVSGGALREPVAWRGPIVMNTPEELQQAFAELKAGTFLRNR